MSKKSIIVTGVECPYCHDIVFSRARHDFRECGCGNIYIDGGFDYFRVGGKVMPEPLPITIIGLNQKDLASDYNTGKNKYGIIDKKEVTISWKPSK